MNKGQNFSPYLKKDPTSYFISLEGIEGSGKSTQIHHLTQYFTQKKYRVINIREPGGTKLGESLRSLILNSPEKITEVSELLLFAASRAHLLTTVILPELERPNTIVIADRYLDSSLAYQGMARGLGSEAVLAIHDIFPLNIMPDLTFYLSIDLATSFKRQAQRGLEKDYFEKETKDFYQKLIAGYEMALKLFPQRIQKIEATSSSEEVFQQIENILERSLI